jgi:hypothetical protein
MTRKFPAASKLAMLLAAAALVAVSAASPVPSQQRYDRDGRPITGPSGPNRVYQQGRAPASASPRALARWHGSVAGRPPDYAFRRRRVLNVRARKPQPPDRPPAVTRRRTWAVIHSASRCIERRSPTKNAGQDRAFYDVFIYMPRGVARMERSEIRDHSDTPARAEPVIGRAFARPVGSIRATDCCKRS